MQLVEDHRLSKTNADTKYAQKVVFIYNAKFDSSKFKRSLNMHVKSICNLINKYSNPEVAKQYGEYLEGLVKAELKHMGLQSLESTQINTNTKNTVRAITILILLQSTVQAS